MRALAAIFLFLGWAMVGTGVALAISVPWALIVVGGLIVYDHYTPDYVEARRR